LYISWPQPVSVKVAVCESLRDFVNVEAADAFENLLGFVTFTNCGLGIVILQVENGRRPRSALVAVLEDVRREDVSEQPICTEVGAIVLLDVFEVEEMPIADLDDWVDHVDAQRGWNRVYYVESFGDLLADTLMEAV
jgi:hypothetical protein